MSAKDLIIDFINTVFIIVLVGFFIVFFIAGDRFEQFGKFIESLIPLAFFGIILLVTLKINRTQLKKRRREANIEINLCLTYFDKLISDVVVCLMPIAIIAASMLANGYVDSIDIFQAVIAFLIMYFWQKFLFKKER